MNPDSNVTFSVTATGATTYQWYKGTTNLFDGGNISGSATATLNLESVKASDSGSYTVVVSNATGYITSSAAVLTVAVVAPPTISSASAAQFSPSSPVSYTITATGLPTLFGATGLPTGLTLDSQSGIISGSIATQGIYTITISATNSLGTGSANLVLTIAQTYAYKPVIYSWNGPPVIGFAVDSSGDVFMSSSANDIIVNGTGTTVAGSSGLVGGTDGPAASARFLHPAGLAVDESGNLYIADTGNDTVRMLSTAGMVTTLAGAAEHSGSTDGVGSAARFNEPSALAVGSDGTIYVADTGNQTIRKIATDGTVSTLAGGPGQSGSLDGTGNAARFNNPAGIAVDSSRNLFVGDSGNFTIRKVSPTGVVTTIAGAAGQPGQVDGAGAAALFTHPSGVAVDSAGDVFVADAALRMINPSGMVTTLSAFTPAYYANNGPEGPFLFNYFVPSVAVAPMTGLALDPSGDIYWSNVNNASVGNEPLEGLPYTPLSIITPPQDLIIFWEGSGGASAFNISVTGSDPTYAWYASGFPISGGSPENGLVASTTNTYAPLIQDPLTAFNRVGDSGTYDVLVYNAGSFVFSGATLLILNPPAINESELPSIGSPETLSVNITAGEFPRPVTGADYTYQWVKDGVAIPGATTSTLAFAALKAPDAGQYWAVVTTSSGSSATAFGVVINFSGNAPMVTTVPQNQTVYAGNPATFTVAATGASLTYQWQLNGVAIPGATSATYTVNNSEPANAGSYTVTITGSGGNVTTIPVTLAVNTTRLINLSARGYAGTGANSLIAGFVTSGAASKVLLIRGIGPSLASFGVTDVLLEPQLNLFNAGQVLLATNAGWGGNASIAAAFAQTGAFPLPSSSADSVLLVNEPAGAYTAQVTALSGIGGNALAEIYDADVGTPAAHLLNLSARGLVGTGSSILIGGFVIDGNASETVLIRGIGPGLASFGVSGTLARPQLTIIDAQGNVVASNAGWGGDQTLSATFAQVGAFALSPTSADAALVTTLSSGDYTAQLSGVGGSTGIALVEIYEVR